MQISTQNLETEALYKLLTGSVVPRPIAWVTTVSKAGVANAAPFSAFTMVSNRPPMLLINVGRIDGIQKDTARNIEATGCFTVNVVVEELLLQMNESSAAFPPHVSEPDKLGIDLLPGTMVASPRIAASPISMECRLHRVLEFGAEGSQSLVGEVVLWHIAEHVYENGKIDQTKLSAVGRVGGPVYSKLGQLVRLPRAYLPPDWRDGEDDEARGPE